MINIFKHFKLWQGVDPLIEGMYADQYNNQQIKDSIRESYKKAHPEPKETPLTHPWKFDPCNPPVGWRYDPYYGLWVTE
jgi:hypothetical protein